jgi:hypothetical protein
MLFLPNGASIAVATMAAAKPVTDLSNALPAVVAAAGHGFPLGAPVLVHSGWSRLDGRVFRVLAPTADAFDLAGVDTTDALRFPAGSGIGSVLGAAAWTQITQILDSSSAGGEQAFFSWQYLEDADSQERQMPTSKSARSFTLTLGDDPSKPWYPVLEAADEAKVTTIVRMLLPSGSAIYYPATVSFDKIPKMTKNQAMALTAVFSMSAAPTRYNA